MLGLTGPPRLLNSGLYVDCCVYVLPAPAVTVPLRYTVPAAVSVPIRTSSPASLPGGSRNVARSPMSSSYCTPLGHGYVPPKGLGPAPMAPTLPRIVASVPILVHSQPSRT